MAAVIPFRTDGNSTIARNPRELALSMTLRREEKQLEAPLPFCFNRHLPSSSSMSSSPSGRRVDARKTRRCHRDTYKGVTATKARPPWVMVPGLGPLDHLQPEICQSQILISFRWEPHCCWVISPIFLVWPVSLLPLLLSSPRHPPHPPLSPLICGRRLDARRRGRASWKPDPPACRLLHHYPPGPPSGCGAFVLYPVHWTEILSPLLTPGHPPRPDFLFLLPLPRWGQTAGAVLGLTLRVLVLIWRYYKSRDKQTRRALTCLLLLLLCFAQPEPGRRPPPL
jgi:hypothetical protein